VYVVYTSIRGNEIDTEINWIEMEIFEKNTRKWLPCCCWLLTNPQWRSYVPGSQSQLATGHQQQVDVYELERGLAAPQWQAQVKTEQPMHQVSEG
jgi:hypothetical protein